MNIIFIHGKDTDPSKKWYPWFGKAVTSMGHEYHAPTLPNADNPILDEWLVEIDALRPNADTVFVGHSRGGVAVLRWLESQPQYVQVRKVILIATNAGTRKDMAIPSESNYGFYTEEGYNFPSIIQHCNDIVVIHSRDDQWVPFSAGVENVKGLNARFLAFDSYGHFGTGVTEIPELLNEIKDCITT